MIKVLQINLNRSKAANFLKDQNDYEKRANILLNSEQYNNISKPEWCADPLATAAIWIVDHVKVPLEASGVGSGYT